MGSPEELRKKLRNETALPEEFSWENMGDNIIQGVELNDRIKKQSQKRRILTYSLVACCMAFISTCGYLHYGSSERGIQELRYAETPVDPIQQEKETEINPEIDQEKVIDRTQKLEPRTIDTDQRATKRTVQRENLNQQIVSSKIVSEEKASNLSLIEREKSISEETGNKPELNDQFTEISALARKDLNPILFSGEEEERFLEPRTAMQKKKTKEKINGSFLSLGSGAMVWKNNIASKDSKEKELLGMTHQVGYGKKIGKRMALEMGLNYKQYNSQLNDTIERSRYEKRNNVLLSTEYNPLYIQPRRTYVDTTIEVIETRRIVHHNQYRIFEVPVSLRYSVPISSKLEIGGRIGTSVGFLQSAKGQNAKNRTLFQLSEPLEKDNEWLVSGNAGLFISRRINDHLVLSGHIEGSRTFNRMKIDDGIFDLQPMSISGLISAAYWF